MEFEKEVYFVAITLLISILLLSACAGDDSSSGSGDGDGGDIGSITLYSPETPELSKELAQKFEEVHGGDVSVHYAGTNVLVNQMMAEKNNPEADVWYGGGGILPFEAAVDKDIITSYIPKVPRTGKLLKTVSK